MTTREHSTSDHLCQIVPVKRPSRAGFWPNARIVDGKATSQAGPLISAAVDLAAVALLLWRDWDGAIAGCR